MSRPIPATRRATRTRAAVFTARCGRSSSLPTHAPSRHLLFPSLILLATVLASRPVYALAPPAPAPTSAKQPGTPPKAPAPAPVRPKGAQTPVQSSTKPATPTATPTARPDAQPDAQPTTDAAAADAKKGAKPAKVTTKAKPGTKATTKTATKGGTKGISIDEEFLIEGKLEKPNAYYILRRSSVDFDWARLGATFSPLVLESVQDPLF